MSKGVLIKVFVSLFVLFLTASSSFAQYRESSTSQGRVISGISREEAVDTFGMPDSAADNLWHYSSPEEFYVSFEPSIMALELCPRIYEVPSGVPVEFKVFAFMSDYSIVDVTSQSKIMSDKAKGIALIPGSGAVMPQGPGEYQVFARYQELYSNPSYLKVKEQPKAKNKDEEVLISIYVLPHNCVAATKNPLNFLALGTFIYKGKYFVRNIADKVEWYRSRDGKVLSSRGETLVFPEAGKYSVFCRYKDVESYSQDVEARDVTYFPKYMPVHLLLLPDMVITEKDNSVKFYAFATYSNGKVEDVSSKVRWEAQDKRILEKKADDTFLPKVSGITSLIAEFEGVTSIPSKITVLDSGQQSKGSAVADLTVIYKNKRSQVDTDSLIRKLKNDTQSLSSDKTAGRRVISVKIVPDYLTLPAGRGAELASLAVYDDNSREEVTLLCDWRSSNTGVVSVSKGKVATGRQGVSVVDAVYKGVKSLPLTVTVTEPQLLSVGVNPQSIDMYIDSQAGITASGYFTDDSVRDITSDVKWESLDQSMLKVVSGSIIPLKMGSTVLFAQMQQVRSVAVPVRVRPTLLWLLGRIVSSVLVAFGLLFLVFIILLLISAVKAAELLKLRGKPRDFILACYGNMLLLLDAAGYKNDDFTPLLRFASMAQDGFCSGKDTLFNLTAKFEEAKYSRHQLGRSDIEAFVKDYNEVLRTLFAGKKGAYSLSVYIKCLLARTPFFKLKI